MERRNQSLVSEFILLGFCVTQMINVLLFALFFISFLVTLLANGLIIMVILAESRLHSPMYFFICNLSLLDLCYSTTNIPTCLKGFLSRKNTITYHECVAQMFMGLSFGVTQCFLLAVMAWDRYVAICNPLNYPRLMNKSICMKLATASWISGFTLSLVQVSFTMTVPFCGRIKINHVVCELVALLRLACMDIHFIEAAIAGICVIVLVAPVSLIVFTYHHIISTILRLPASERHKAFSTCSSHLTVVTMFYGTLIVMYMRPRSMISIEKEKVASVFYGVLTPALNPLIYSLRNKEVKGALTNLLRRSRAGQRMQG
ncbi:olfactory receptor 13C4-like [Pleurodeles waltl]|uniref:olfactory receptor 13C4-like n=1 Tax=Pleurodeles waltl TaxID=8319 RepID=UPI0037099145